MNIRDTAPDDRYETIEGRLEQDRDTVIGIWRGHIGWQAQLERMYDVYYLDCPFGRPLLQLLRHRASGEIVGTLGAGPRPMLWQGRELRAAAASHLAVLPGHRSLRPALQLLRDMTVRGLEQFEFAYGLTNALGGAIGLRGGYSVPVRLRRYVKVLRYRRFAQRVLPGPLGRAGGALLDGAVAVGRQPWLPGRRSGLHAAWTDAIDPRMQALWERSERGDGLSTMRTATMLEWRLLRLPALRRRFLLVAPAAGAPLLAWFACEANAHVPGLMTVTDAWFAGGVREADRRAVRELCRMAYAAGCEGIEVRLAAAAPVLEAWRAEGFVARGEQPLFVAGMDPGSAGVHITDIEQDG
ncbi:MAG: hypothetical protein BGP10_03905 [Rhodanobacter sp. 68-29]|nr:hypothetical protein [Rhodanobacter sp.]ODU73296.1 MAG: hypothetical protein ABT17_12660 [Rhodanobacter sp. SCN 69-32]OJY57595.1 MAG: hypothetical protein BGP10_03905 [Rhodanobacter sp. 68-29]